jgi:hypothetical protein
MCERIQYMCMYVGMYVKKLSFHVCKYYVCTYTCVCIYLQGTSVKGRSHFLCGNLTDILLTCVFYMRANRIWRRHDWMKKGCTRLYQQLTSKQYIKKTLLFRYSVNLCVSLNKHTHIITQIVLANYSFYEQGIFSP